MSEHRIQSIKLYKWLSQIQFLDNEYSAQFVISLDAGFD